MAEAEAVAEAEAEMEAEAREFPWISTRGELGLSRRHSSRAADQGRRQAWTVSKARSLSARTVLTFPARGTHHQSLTDQRYCQTCGRVRTFRARSSHRSVALTPATTPIAIGATALVVLLVITTFRL